MKRHLAGLGMAVLMSVWVCGCGGGGGEGVPGAGIAGIWRSSSATNAQGRPTDPVAQFMDEDAYLVSYFTFIFGSDSSWSIGLRAIDGSYAEDTTGSYSFNGTDLTLISGGGRVTHGAALNGDLLTLSYRTGPLTGQTTTFERMDTRADAGHRSAATDGLLDKLLAVAR